MNPILKNVLALIAGIAIGMLVNGALGELSGRIIPHPEGADVSTIPGLIEAMPHFGPQNFIMPFLAHSLGTFIGALITAMVAANNKMKFAIAIGIFFLLAGIYAAILLPAPLWFIMVDLIGAYIPMAYLAGGMVRPRRAVV